MRPWRTIILLGCVGVLTGTPACSQDFEENPPLPQPGGNDTELGSDELRLVAREGKKTNIGWAEVFGCGPGQPLGGSASGSGFSTAEGNTTTNQGNFSWPLPGMRFTIETQRGVEGNAVAACSLWSQEFVVRPAEGQPQSDTTITGDLNLSVDAGFVSGEATPNNYEIEVILSFAGLSGIEVEEQKITYCKKTIHLPGGTVFEVCSEVAPVPPLQEFQILIPSAKFPTDDVYKARVQVLASMTSADGEPELGGYIEGEFFVTDLSICLAPSGSDEPNCE